MRIVDPIFAELDQEAATTKRLLERVPEGKMEWRPHTKSMSLGQLALHVAMIPGQVAVMASQNEYELPDFSEYPAARTAGELLLGLDLNVARAKVLLNGLDDRTAMSTWRLTTKGKELLSLPRMGVVRFIMLNHWYHHRGQLAVYLRLLDVPVPAIYGPSADENPFV